MSTINVQVQYNAAANAASWGRRNVGIQPVGVYTGGFWDAANAEVSPFVAEIAVTVGDVVYQFRAEMVEAAALDAGTVGANKLIVAKLVWDGASAAVVTVEAVAAGGDLSGCVVLCGFDSGGNLTYASRTVPALLEYQGRVEAISGLNVLVTGAQYRSATGLVTVGTQVLALSGSSTLYIYANGTVWAATTVLPAALVVASVVTTTVVGTITDTRPWLAAPSGMQLVGEAAVTSGYLQLTAIPAGLKYLKLAGVLVLAGGSSGWPALQFGAWDAETEAYVLDVAGNYASEYKNSHMTDSGKLTGWNRVPLQYKDALTGSAVMDFEMELHNRSGTWKMGFARAGVFVSGQEPGYFTITHGCWFNTNELGLIRLSLFGTMNKAVDTAAGSLGAGSWLTVWGG